MPVIPTLIWHRQGITELEGSLRGQPVLYNEILVGKKDLKIKAKEGQLIVTTLV